MLSERHITDSYMFDKLQTALNASDVNIADLFANDDPLFIYRSLQQLQEELSFLSLENFVLHTFLEKNYPESLAIGTTKKFKTITFSKDVYKSSRYFSKTDTNWYESVGRSGLSQAHTFEVNSGLSYLIKTELAEKLCQEIQTRSDKEEASGKVQAKNLKAHNTELKMRISELTNTYEAAFHNRRQSNASYTIQHGRFIKFFDSWIKHGMEYCNVMGIKLAAIKRKYLTLKAALVTREGIAGIITVADFELLKIKRNSLTQQLEDNNLHFIQLKKVAGNVSLAVTIEKKKLIKLENVLRDINNKISFIKKESNIVDKKILKVEKEIIESEDNIFKMEQSRELHEAPTIKEYINKKNELQLVLKEEKLLEREMYLLSVKLQNARNSVAERQHKAKYSK